MINNEAEVREHMEKQRIMLKKSIQKPAKV